MKIKLSTLKLTDFFFFNKSDNCNSIKSSKETFALKVAAVINWKKPLNS